MTAEQDNFINAVESVANRVLDNVSTSFPGTIVAPSKIEGLVDVQPNVKFKAFGSDDEIEPKPINNVVLVYPVTRRPSSNSPWGRAGDRGDDGWTT